MEKPKPQAYAVRNNRWNCRPRPRPGPQYRRHGYIGRPRSRLYAPVALRGDLTGPIRLFACRANRTAFFGSGFDKAKKVAVLEHCEFVGFKIALTDQPVTLVASERDGFLFASDN